ncbi:hypothetical protein CTM76_01425 [Photobacterium phosphoreum]|nr:hypothetical protein UB41_08625 [Photobacterium phosphoreum]PQJ91135.1 hypothetical protein BTO21_05220 [Photobacterium phosphoreum]PSU40110.1 hypothetical protein CTM85_04030 [Photobacterium phosphoreum]PSU61086.1 hypothetical protein CTM75_13610 [Photobacterium phosphoreum]PSU67458.1 hypothetical protein CTM79_15975 [Photobacterium phosphoreum]
MHFIICSCFDFVQETFEMITDKKDISMKLPINNNNIPIIIFFVHKNSEFDLQITDQRLIFIVDQYSFTVKAI